MALRGNKAFPLTQSVVALYLMLQGGLLVAVAMWFLKRRRVSMYVTKTEVLEDKGKDGLRLQYVMEGLWGDKMYRATREDWFTGKDDPLYPLPYHYVLCYVPWYPFVEIAPTFVPEARSLEGLAYAFGIASLVAGALTLITAWMGFTPKHVNMLVMPVGKTG